MRDAKAYHVGAVDGGGSGCRVALCTPDGRTLAIAQGGPANYHSDPAETAHNVLDALSEAGKSVGISEPPAACHVGVAGILNNASAQDLVRRLALPQCAVTDDRATTAVGALGSRRGVVLAIGTGSFAAIRSSNGTRFLGGWGLGLGDQASGARLGRDLLEQVLLAFDGLAEESNLTRTVLARFKGAPDRIVDFAGAGSPGDLAAFAPLVADAADNADPVGVKLMHRGAEYLTRIVEQATLSDDEILCLTGGLGLRYAPYLPQDARDRLAEPAGSALDGAIALALAKISDAEVTS